MAYMNSKWFVRHRCLSYSRSRGAVLLAVLILMMMLSFMLLSLSSVLESRLAIAQSSSQLLKDKATAYAKLQELTYLIGTQRITRAGVSRGVNAAGLNRRDGQWMSVISGDEVRYDGFLYKGAGGLVYSLQNEAGLIPVNNPNQTWLKRWLSAQGNDLSATNRLADTLYDYADADNWKRPAGAEVTDYTDANLAAPSNFLLQSCPELHAVLGWSELIKRRPEVLSQCSLSRLSYLNINAVPVSLWQKLWPDSSQQLMQMRLEGNWFTYPEDVFSIEPAMIGMPEVYYVVLGGDIIIAHVNVGKAEYMQRVQVGTDQQPPFIVKAIPQSERTRLGSDG